MVKKLIVLLTLGLMLAATAGLLQRAPNRTDRTTAQLLGPQIEGKIAFVHKDSIWIYSGDRAQQLTATPKDRLAKRDAQPSFSPDGTQLVYVRFDEGFSDLYKLDINDPRDPTPLTDHRPNVEVGQASGPGVNGYNELALWALYPAWSPDGQEIAYTSDIGTEYPGLFSMDPDGGTVTRLETLNHGIQTVERPSWSPTGTRLAITNYVTDNSKGQIWMRDLVGGKWIEITNAKDGAYDPAWAPDGEWIAFTMRQGTAHNIYVVPTNPEDWPGDHPTPIQITTDGASRSPAWSPDGTRLAYLSMRNAMFDIYEGKLTTKTNGDPSLASVQRLTENADIDGNSGLSWGQ